jgi:hypothetical protein
VLWAAAVHKPYGSALNREYLTASISAPQMLTTGSLLELRDIDATVPWIPIFQGYEMEHYALQLFIKWILPWMFPRKPLGQLIPDLQQLLATPADYLARHDVLIRSVRHHRNPLFLALSLPFTIPFLWWFFTGVWSWNVVFWGCAAGLVFLVMTIAMRCIPQQKAIELLQHGVELHHGNGTSVWLPWQLFSLPGKIVSEKVGSLTLPVAAPAIPHIEFRRGGAPVAYGIDAKNFSLWFGPGDTITFLYIAEADPKELGELLLRLGAQLGAKPLTGWAPR